MKVTTSLLTAVLPHLVSRAEGYSLSGKTVPAPEGIHFRNTSSAACDADEATCGLPDASEYLGGDEAAEVMAMRDSIDHYGVAQNTDDRDVPAFIANWRAYMADEVMVDPKYASVRGKCKNKHELCSYWAMLGECTNNPSYMQTNCAPACQSCEQMEYSARCPFDPSAAANAFEEKGDVDRFFERIVADEAYNVTVHSRPKGPEDDDAFVDGPWLITLEDFVSADEAQRLIDLGGEEGYERSTDVGSLQDDGSYTKDVHSTRTSSNAWCLAKCMSDPIARNVVSHIEQMTQIPQTNSESLQLLKYGVGQEYQRHHDLIEHQKDRPPGVRILTVYIYLNGEEEGLEGGGTNFPRLGVTVTPKRGRVALWSSVLNDSPHEKDSRTDHAALPVTKGVKYGANAWIHQRDYMTPNRKGCA
ncbi:hypothetical protein ACHAXT_001364 [Thalassiosira profunda]